MIAVSKEIPFELGYLESSVPGSCEKVAVVVVAAVVLALFIGKRQIFLRIS